MQRYILIMMMLAIINVKRRNIPGSDPNPAMQARFRGGPDMGHTGGVCGPTEH